MTLSQLLKAMKCLLKNHCKGRASEARSIGSNGMGGGCAYAPPPREVLRNFNAQNKYALTRELENTGIKNSTE